MSDDAVIRIRIYCYNDSYFLVTGESYLSDILRGRLPEDADLEILDTNDYSKVLSEWESFNPSSTPWMIHPNIAMEYRERLREKAIGPIVALPPDPPVRRPARFRLRRDGLPGRRS